MNKRWLGFAWTWWVIGKKPLIGWTDGYVEGERIFWIGPLGLIYGEG